MRPPSNAPFNQSPNAAWETAIRQRARHLPYPPTPDVAEKVMARLATERGRGPMRRWQPLLVAGLLLALLIGLWAVPSVRAALLEFLQIGGVQIWLVEPTPTPAMPTPSASPANAAPRNTPRPTPTPLSSLANLSGKTTLSEAEAKAGFSITLPTYPPDLGPPDAVFFQDMNGPLVVLVWMKPDQPDEAAYSLHIFHNGLLAEKMNPRVVMTTTVNGNAAAWTNGPYLLTYGVAGALDWQINYLVSGQVLIWSEDGLTYRLESNLGMQETVRMAESLK